MNLTGNKILTTLLLAGSVLSATVQAESPVDNSETIELTTFSANTPAKAADVNGNFEALKDSIVSLQQELTKLKSLSPYVPKEYTIAIYGDGELVGHVIEQERYSKPPSFKRLNSDEIFSFIKQDDSFEFRSSNIGRAQLFYTDDKCEGEPVLWTSSPSTSFAHRKDYQQTFSPIYKDDDGNFYSVGDAPIVREVTALYGVNFPYPIPPHTQPPGCYDQLGSKYFVLDIQPADGSEYIREFTTYTIEGYVHPE